MRLSLPPLGRAWQREATLASLMMGHNERRFYKNNPHGTVVSYFQPLFLTTPWDKGKEMEREGPQDSAHLFPGLSCQPRGFQTRVTWRLGEPGGQAEHWERGRQFHAPLPQVHQRGIEQERGNPAMSCCCQKVSEWIPESRRQLVPKHKIQHFWICLKNQK